MQVLGSCGGDCWRTAAKNDPYATLSRSSRSPRVAISILRQKCRLAAEAVLRHDGRLTVSHYKVERILLHESMIGSPLAVWPYNEKDAAATLVTGIVRVAGQHADILASAYSCGVAEHLWNFVSTNSLPPDLRLVILPWIDDIRHRLAGCWRVTRITASDVSSLAMPSAAVCQLDDLVTICSMASLEMGVVQRRS